ncbi:MAG: GNAT family N-acetyltransferase [Flavobacteriaceae bacterium]|nr:GNAT family N-acetyltransferase [Flavobacteriaceae bacterium]
MIKVSDDIKLVEIKSENQEELYDLMSKIYTPIYEYLWKDGGARYIDSLYNNENLKEELAEPNSRYYFVKYKNNISGILRVLLSCKLDDYENVNCFKLQRIYLDSSTRGYGVGKKLINWVADTHKTTGKNVLWLETMREKAKAVDFYMKMGFEIHSEFDLDIKGIDEDYKQMYRLYKVLK